MMDREMERERETEKKREWTVNCNEMAVEAL